jgi:hypothetical protein
MKILGIYTAIILLVSSCKKADSPATVNPAPVLDPCIGVTVTPVVDKGFTTVGLLQGSITVTSPIGSGITYSIGGAYQASTNFFTLAAGAYTVSAKTAVGCIGNTSATIVSYGAKYYEVKKIITGYCGPCHLNGTVSGGRNFDTDNSIVAAWDRIKARAVDNLPSVMPQGGPLTAIDKQKIVDWVNAGHLITN